MALLYISYVSAQQDGIYQWWCLLMCTAGLLRRCLPHVVVMLVLNVSCTSTIYLYCRLLLLWNLLFIRPYATASSCRLTDSTVVARNSSTWNFVRYFSSTCVRWWMVDGSCCSVTIQKTGSNTLRLWSTITAVILLEWSSSGKESNLESSGKKDIRTNLTSQKY